MFHVKQFSHEKRCYNSFGDSLTIFPPDVELQVDLYIQLGRIMELVKESLPIFNIQAIQYKEA